MVQCGCAESDGGKVVSRLSANQLVAALCESPDGSLAWASIGVHGLYTKHSMPLPSFSTKQTPSVLAKMSMCWAMLSRERGMPSLTGATMHVHVNYTLLGVILVACRVSTTEYVPKHLRAL